MSAPPTTPSSGDRSREEPSDVDAERAEAVQPELARLRARVSELESQLDKKEREIEAVRRQYETILQERTAERDTDGLLSVLR